MATDPLKCGVCGKEVKHPLYKPALCGECSERVGSYRSPELFDTCADVDILFAACRGDLPEPDLSNHRAHIEHCDACEGYLEVCDPDEIMAPPEPEDKPEEVKVNPGLREAILKQRKEQLAAQKKGK